MSYLTLDGSDEHAYSASYQTPLGQAVQHTIAQSKNELDHSNTSIQTKREPEQEQDDIMDVLELIGKKLSSVSLTGVAVPQTNDLFIEDVNAVYLALKTDDDTFQTNAMIRIKNFLCTSDDINKRAQYILDMNFMSLFKACLHPSKPWELQYECAWAITNYASGKSEYTTEVVNADLVDPLITLLSSPNGQVRTQAAWALGNIAGDSRYYRDLLINQGVIQPLLCIHLGHHDTSKRRSAALHVSAWAIGNLCRYRHFDWEKLSAVYPFIRDMLIENNDTELISECCWALQRIFNDCNVMVKDIICVQLCGRLVQLLRSESRSVVTPVLKAITNILSSSDDGPADFFIERGLLDELKVFIDDGVPSSKLDALYVLANVAAGSHFHIQCIIDDGFIGPLCETMKGNDAETRREACWTVSNLVKGGQVEQVRTLADQGCLHALIQYIHTHRHQSDQSLLKASDALTEILKIGDIPSQHDSTSNLYVDYIKSDQTQFKLLHDTYKYLRERRGGSEWTAKSFKQIDLVIKRWFLEFSIVFESGSGMSYLLDAMSELTV